MGSYTNYLSACVTRSHLWKSIADLYVSQEFPIFALWEIYMNLILSYCGKSKVLNNLMHFRSHGEGVPIRNNIPSLSLRNTLFDVWRNEMLFDLREKFVWTLASAFDELLSGAPTCECGKVALERAIEAYCQCLENRGKRKGSAVLSAKLIPSIVRDLFGSLYEVPRRLAGRNFTLEQAIRQLELSGVVVDHSDVGLVVSSVKNYYGY